VLNNIEAARSQKVQDTLYEEFYLPHFRDTIRRWFEESRRWTVYMHEVIGHGSGQAEPGLAADPRTLVGRAYSSLEECRSDLVALYHIFDERLVEIGAFAASDREAIIEACYIGYLQGHMARYRSIPEDTVREAHRRGGELILQYLARGGRTGGSDFGVRIVRDAGRYFVDLSDVRKARAGVGELLGLLQTMKSRGDEKGASGLFDQMGTRLDPDIRRDITARAERLRIPRATAFVFPRLEPIVEAGRVVDARLRCDEDLTAQQLRIARWRFNRDAAPSS
jgi:dipeptidyl-peptidase-3